MISFRPLKIGPRLFSLRRRRRMEHELVGNNAAKEASWRAWRSSRRPKFSAAPRPMFRDE